MKATISKTSMILLLSSGSVRYMTDPTNEELQILDTLVYDPTNEGSCLLELCKELNDEYGDVLYDILTSEKWQHVTNHWVPTEPIQKVYLTHLYCDY